MFQFLVPNGGTVWEELGVALLVEAAFGVLKDLCHSQCALCSYMWIKEGDLSYAPPACGQALN